MKETIKKFCHNNSMLEGTVFFVISVLGIIFSIKSHNDMEIEWKLSPYLFPLVISLLLFLLSISLLLEGRKLGSVSKKKAEIHWKNIFLYCAICFAYYLLISYIGFIVTTIIFLVATFLMLGVKKWYLVALLSIGSTLAIYVLFAVLLHVMLPEGIIYYYIGF